MTKNNKKRNISFSKYLSIILVVISLIATGLIYFIDLLPFKYFGVFLIIVFSIDLILIKMLLKKRMIQNVIGILFSIIFIILMVLGINYELNTLDFFKQFGYNSYKTEVYNVLVLKNSKYKEIDELENISIGRLPLLNREGLQKANNKLLNKIKFQEKELEDISALTSNLLNKEVEAILLEEAQLEILSEENYDVYEKLESIYKIKIEIKIKKIGSDVDIKNEPFNIYISGMDTYGSITKVSRSDVNIVVTVNPTSKEMLLTSIPRDYYVTLDKINESDKLTHAGIYGIETSVHTIENLLDTKINYYVKVNFTSLINIVDALGGINVNSDYSFNTIDGYSFKKGINNLNGKEALSFSRERKAFKEGDRIRGKNQEKVLTAIINKAMSPTIISKYTDILKAFKGNFITNLENEKITDFIKEQIKNPSSWSINSIALDGTNTYDYTYSYKNNKLYVMKPSLESINNAKVQINSVINK